MIILKTILSYILIAVILLPNAFAFGENYQIESTTNNKLDVMIFTVPEHPNLGDETKLKIEFLKPMTRTLQEHIDYTINIEKNLKLIFQIPLTHTSIGSITIPFEFDENGSYDVYVEVRGILFSPTNPIEKAIFTIQVGQLTDHQFKHTEEISIPNWVKNNAGWWAQGQIDDSDFVSGIQYLISNGIMTVPQTQSSQSSNEDIPDWVKNNAGWWSQNKIGDSDFVSGIQYLISNGIMNV